LPGLPIAARLPAGPRPPDLSDGGRLIDVCLKLLENSQEFYRRCDDEQRRGQ
jgi:hypothetical protein